MPLKLVRLEERLLFDAAAAGVIADAAAAAAAEGDAASADSIDSYQADQSSESTDNQSPEGSLLDAVNRDQVNVLVVSSDVENAQHLAAAAADDVIAIVYDAEKATLEDLYAQIQESLAGKQADTIGFATHGQSGMFHITQDLYVSANTLAEDSSLAAFWKDLGSLMSENGRVDLIGCNIAGIDGNDFGLLAALEALTNVDLAASTDKTGNAEGDNWYLEVGDIDADFYFSAEKLAGWNGSLATFTVTNVMDSGAGSLRKAITDANAMSGTDTIVFDLDVSTAKTISLVTDLPTITETVIIDATGSSPGITTGYSFGTNMVTIDASTPGGDILEFTDDDNIIRGLNLINGDAGILLDSKSNTVENNLIGIDLSGSAAGNTRGVELDNSDSNTIGGTTSSERNVISGNTTGIYLSSGSTSNTISGNYIGTDSTGDAAVANTTGIEFDNGDSNTIGGTIAGERNIISGNTTGISLLSGSKSNTISGNYIGVDSGGDTALANTTGISFTNADNNTIGGTIAGERNIISGNTTGFSLLPGSSGNIISGNYIGTDSLGTSAIANTTGLSLSNADNNDIGGDTSGERNIISGNTTGISLLSGTGGTDIFGNYIGTDVTGEAALGNTTGISIDTTSGGNDIGGSTSGDRNVISGNTDGIVIERGNHDIQGNYIGTDDDGDQDLGNTRYGIHSKLGNSTIGGNSSSFRNVISNNDTAGIYVEGGRPTIRANYIGVNTDGDAILGNEIGIKVDSTSSNVRIGGTSSGQGNVISGNTTGIELNAGNSDVYGNIIGLNADGDTDLGNTSYGVHITASSGTSDIGNNTGSRNIISGNDTAGIFLEGGDANIRINYIGLNEAGDAGIGNGIGIKVDSTATDVDIGHSSASRGNVISSNSTGIQLNAGNSNILSNIIGLNAAGDTDLGNTLYGIHITASSGFSDIGNNSNGRNTISGNDSIGIFIAGGDTRIRNNYIGTDSTGETAIGNSTGIKIDSTESNEIGRSGAGRNVISGNTIGLEITAGTQTVIRNYIGLDKDGDQDLGNTTSGIVISGGTDHIIGQTGGNRRNIISGNDSFGVNLTSGNATFVNNRIGTSNDGETAIGNGIGIKIDSATSSTIGGDASNERNVISGNTDGIELVSGTHTVTGNYIGTDDDGTQDLGNTRYGINISGGSSHVIGDTATNGRNIISGNDTAGVNISSGNATFINNRIGTSSNGESAIANGIGIKIDSAASSTIGGDASNERNIISGNVDGIELVSGAHTVTGNYIGTDDDGREDVGNTRYGINISGGTSHSIGGTATGEGNLISGNDTAGIYASAGSATIYNNLIGVRDNGESAIANLTGVELDSSSTIVVGGSGTNERNVISGNTDGVILSDGAHELKGNYIGLDDEGNESLGNTQFGVHIKGGAGHTIGGTGTGEGNVISANDVAGIKVTGGTATVLNNFIGTEADGTTANGNATGVIIDSSTTFTLGGTALGGRNVISANTTGVELISGSHSIVNNYIGTNKDGTADLGNTTDGVLVSGGSGHSIGIAGGGNVISGNNDDGINGMGGSSVKVLDNIIGLNKDGDTIIKNSEQGIDLESGADSWTIGGSTAASRNIISGNDLEGVLVRVGSHTVLGNYIGTDTTGVLDRGNTGNGITFMAGSGASSEVKDNVISANSSGVSGSVAMLTVKGNIIGLAVDGATVLGNTLNGVLNPSGDSWVVGGLAAGEGNVISGNFDNGLSLSGSSHTIEGNFIGTDSTGMLAKGNGGHGVLLEGSSSTLNDNIVSANGGYGIVVDGVTAVSNFIDGNSIYNNVMGGILLDSGGNRDQEPPHDVKAEFFLVDDELVISGFMDGLLGESYLIQIYSDAKDAIGGAQGKDFLESFTVVTASTTFFSHTVTTALPSDMHFISLTATNIALSDTSEFVSVVVKDVAPTPPSGPDLAEPQYTPTELPRPIKGPLYSVLGSDTDPFSSFPGRGFINVLNRNQLTSYGSNLGYGALIGQGDMFMSFVMRDGEPVLMNRNSYTGYSAAARALNFVEREETTSTETIQEFIESFSGLTTEFGEGVDVEEPGLKGSIKRILNRLP